MDKTRSYEYTIKYLNKDKKEHIENVIYTEWKRVAGILVNRHLEYFYINRNSKICNDNSLYKSIDTFLSERYKDVINRQVVGMLKSKLSNFKKRFNQIVNKLDLSKEKKKDLNIAFKRNIVFKNSDDIGVNYKVSFETIKLARWIFRHFIGKWPSTKNINMVMQHKICEIQTPELENTKFQYFLRMTKGDNSIPTKDRFIVIPLVKNKYADKKEGVLSTSCTFCFDKGKMTKITFSKTSKATKEKKTKIKISFDIGLNILFALNNGETYGEHFMRYLKRIDKQITGLQNKLKKEYGKHVKLTEFDEYNRLINKRRARIKNEVNKLINKIVKKHGVDNLILEQLGFKGSKLARKVNRLLGNFGLGIITKKLESLKEGKGIKISYIDAAYTSQTCSNKNCGYIDRRNRKSQEKFECKFCGKKINADVNGSRTVGIFSERFGEKMFYTKDDRNKKRTLIVNDFVDSEVWMNGSRRAIQALIDNDYFSDYRLMFREKLRQMS